ncbi:MAG: NAD(P)/FAD-dependent oxidoreductase [Pseudomonadota bacterium]
MDVDAIVVGAGAVGLAAARALARRGLVPIVLEREAAIGQGVSSRNSEVVHAGLYYRTGSLKARLCVEGRRALYAYCDERGVPYRKCGKLVVATEAAEEPRLEAILKQAETNSVEGMAMLTGAEVRALEPELKATAALLSPESGVFDSHAYMLALQGEIEDAGGAVVLSSPFEGAAPIAGGWSVHVGGAEPTTVTTPRFILTAGLGAQAAAAQIDGFPSHAIPTLRYGKGHYFSLTGKAPFEHLIYPPPIPGALGTHYRKDMGGRAIFGPDLEFVDREDYSVPEARAASFYDTIRRFWPALSRGALIPDYAGVRPKLHGPGEPQPDWRIDGREAHGMAGLVAMFGVESPGLTASLAIGEHAAALLK